METNRIVDLSQYKKAKLPRNIFKLTPMAKGISRDGNVFLCNYLVEVNSEGIISDNIFSCLLFIFKNFTFRLVQKKRIEEVLKILQPEEMDSEKIKESVLKKAEGDDQFKYAYLSFTMLDCAVNRFCDSEAEKTLLRKWHAFMLCMIFREVADEQ